MLDLLRHIDHQLFEFINSTCANSIADVLCPLFREKLFWLPLYIFLSWWAVIKYKSKALWLFVFAVATIVASDQIASHIIKPFIHRLRPCNNPEMVNTVRLLLTHCGNGYSFVSAHAANHFALAAFIWLTFPKSKWLLLVFVWALVVSISQVYVGVHYPADIVGGAILGSGIGYITGTWCTLAIQKDNFHPFSFFKKT